MTILHSLQALSTVPGPVALAIGVFDGLHLGHQEVIRAAQEHAARVAGSEPPRPDQYSGGPEGS